MDRHKKPRSGMELYTIDSDENNTVNTDVSSENCGDISRKGRSRRRDKKTGSGGVWQYLAAVFCILAAAALFGLAAFLYFGSGSDIHNDIRNIAAGITGRNGSDQIEDQKDGVEDNAAEGTAAADAAGENHFQYEESTACEISETDSENDDPEAVRKERIDALSAQGYHIIEQADPDSISISFAGDILFDEHYAIMSNLLSRSGGADPDISKAFDETLLNEMRSADIFMVNNEFPYSDRGAPLKDKQFTFRARPQYASLLKDIGADIVALANNHINDYGIEAMTDTLKTLNEIGMPYAGAGMNIEEASKPVYFTNGDVRIAVIAATQIERMSNPDTVGAGENTPGVFRCMSEAELKRLTDRIAEAKSDGCFVIVYVHWGTEGTEKLDSWQIEQGKAIADAGADIIIGDHPHVLQGLDYIGERKVPVIYSLGNYLFNSKTLDTCIYKLKLDAKDGSIREICVVPAIQSGCRTAAAKDNDARRILTHLQELSPNVAIDINTGIINNK